MDDATHMRRKRCEMYFRQLSLQIEQNKNLSLGPMTEVGSPQSHMHSPKSHMHFLSSCPTNSQEHHGVQNPGPG